MTKLSGHVNGDFGIMDFADQLSHGFIGDLTKHIQYGKLDGGQRHSQRDAIVSEIKTVYVDSVHDQIQLTSILSNKKFLQLIDEDGEKRAKPTVPDGNSL